MLDRESLSAGPLQLAPLLLGARLSAHGVSVRLTEVEAYAGTRDPGSHAYRGITPRTAVMFGPAGHLYVYFSYGLHWCVNVVCGPEGEAAAVLLRAGEVVAGEDLARSRRDAGRSRPHPARDLARGPARLASALGLGREHNGLDMLAPDSPVTLTLPTEPVGPVHRGGRVGVSGPGGDPDLYPWRFWLAEESSVSAYRPGTSGRRAARRADPGPGRS